MDTIPSVQGWPIDAVEALGGADAADGAFAGLLERLRVGVLTLDGEGRVRAASPVAAELLGGPEAVVPGVPLAGLFAEGDRERVEECLRGDPDSEHPPVVCEGPPAAGAPLVVELRLAQGRGGGRAAAVALVQDVTGRAIADRERHRAESALRALAAQQDALRRIVLAVADDEPLEAILALAAEEVARLLGIEAAGIVRFDEDDSATIVGFYGAGGTMRLERGTRVPLDEDSAIGRVWRTGEPARLELEGGDTGFGRVYEERVAAPIQLDGGVWGAVLAATSRRRVMPPRAELRLTRFAEVLSVGVAAAARDDVEASAGPSAPGVVAHRAFYGRLGDEVERARRHGRDLALTLFVVDDHGQLTDAHGLKAGDAVVNEVAERLAELTRRGEILARVGGERLALLLPETNGLEALAVAERLRRAVTAVPFETGWVTLSAGICDVSEARAADDLFRLADAAVAAAVANGRSSAVLYRADAVPDIGAQERAERIARAHAVAGVRALARGVEARSPFLRGHSERVADLAARLAGAAGWDEAMIARLREAALIHDVGLVGVSAGLVLRAGPLRREELDEVRTHAAIGGRIAADVLSPEQSRWVRAHHERPDGAGYPDGLAGDDVPDGARLLALAEAWDAMTTWRPHRPAKSYDAAFAECRDLAGEQFADDAVEALSALWLAGVLRAAES